VTPGNQSLIDAYNRLFGGQQGQVNLGGYTGGTTTNPIVPTPGTGTNVTNPANIPAPPSVPLPGFPGVTFTPGQPQYFGTNTGGMLPGTLPSSYNPFAAYKGPMATTMLANNPNLSPTVLGGPQGLGYYTDRLGNRILSPGGALMRFAEGGEVDKDDSAKAELARLLASMPARETTEGRLSPNAQSIKRTSVDRGAPRGMGLESLSAGKASGTTDQGSAAEQLRALMAEVKKSKGPTTDLMRRTFSEPTLDRAGPLAARRFAEGGEVDPTDERMVPLHLRTYIASMLGGKTKEPITEANLSGAELTKLRRLIELAKTRPVHSKETGEALPHVVTYAHHDTYKDRYERLGGAPGPDTDKTLYSTANLRNTLGTFSFKEMPDGSLVVTDNYDFTGDVGEKDNWLIQQANKAGVNRPVKIVVPPKKRK
jgi:hypothetical protein